MVRMFQILAEEKQLRTLTSGLMIEKAEDYTPKKGDTDYLAKNDVPWVTRFANAGGKVVISGDTRMKSRPHERLALVQAGMVTIFFEPQWSSWPFFRKCSLLIHWWPEIAKTAKVAKPSTFWHVPAHWNEGTLRQVSNEDQKLVKMQRQLKMRDVVRAMRRKKQDESQGTLAFEDKADA